jgi:hypothetical protein
MGWFIINQYKPSLTNIYPTGFTMITDVFLELLQLISRSCAVGTLVCHCGAKGRRPLEGDISGVTHLAGICGDFI